MKKVAKAVVSAITDLRSELVARLHATEAARLGRGVGRDTVLWRLRAAFFLSVRLTGRYWLLKSNLSGWRRTATWIGAGGDFVAARGLRRETYPLGVRVPFEVLESAVISVGLADHNAAAQMTIPTLIELGYRGGLGWALPVSAAQIGMTTALRAAAGRKPNMSVYLFQVSAFFGIDRLAALELERQHNEESLAAVRSREAVESGYRAGRYAAATETIGEDEAGQPVIPHDTITPIAAYLGAYSSSLRSPAESALATIGPRQQKAHLRGLSIGLLDALIVWRTEANQRRPRLDDQLSTPSFDNVADGDRLLTPIQQSGLLEALDALELRGGPLHVTVVNTGPYASRMVLWINGNLVTVAADELAFATTATNLMRAARPAALFWALLEMQPSQNGLPFPAGLAASVPAIAWLALGWRGQDKNVEETAYLRAALLVAGAHTAITALIVRHLCPERPSGYAPYALSLFAPATMIGGSWSRLSNRERVGAVGALVGIALAGRAAVTHPRAFLVHAFQIAVCFASGVAFDRARTEKLGSLSAEATEHLRLLRDTATTRGRLDELDLCHRACEEAVEAITTELERVPDSEKAASNIRHLDHLIRSRITTLVGDEPSENPLVDFTEVLDSQRRLAREVWDG